MAKVFFVLTAVFVCAGLYFATTVISYHSDANRANLILQKASTEMGRVPSTSSSVIFPEQVDMDIAKAFFCSLGGVMSLGFGSLLLALRRIEEARTIGGRA